MALTPNTISIATSPPSTCRGQQRMDTEWHRSSHHHHQRAGGNEQIPGRGPRDRRLETQMRLEFLVCFFLFFFFFYWLLIFTPTPPTSPSLQPNLRPHQRVEAATQEWQQQQGLETWHVSSCWYVFFYFIFNLITFFFRYTETAMGAAAAHDTQPPPPPPPTSLQPSPRPP